MIYTGKTFLYKVYTPAGVYLTTWDDVVSEPNFSRILNGSLSDTTITLARKFDAFGEGVDVALSNKVLIYAVDRDDPNGILIYSGFISGYQPTMTAAGESVDVTLLPYASLLEQDILVSGSNTTVTYSSQDPSDILKDILDKANQVVDYATGSVDTTGLSISYDFNTATYLQAIQAVLAMAPTGWYFHIGADNIIQFHDTPGTTTHTLIVGVHLAEVRPMKRLENVKNVVLFVGDGIYKKYTRPGSISSYGQRVYVYQDNRVSVEASADILAGNYLDNNESPEIRTTIRVLDSNYDADKGYDIESINPGDTILLKGFGVDYPASLWDSATWDVSSWDFSIAGSQNIAMRVMSVAYTPDHVDIELSSRLIPQNRRIEDIYKNLVNFINSSNPTAPS